MTTRKTKNSSVPPGREGGSAAPMAPMEALRKLRIVIRAAQRHSSWIEKQCGISGAQLWIMDELRETPGMRVGEIAQRLSIHQTTTSNLLDALVKKGYVLKSRDPADQRVVKLALSRQGSQLLSRAPTPVKGLLPEALRQLNGDALTQLNDGLDGLLRVIESVDEAQGMQPMPFMM